MSIHRINSRETRAWSEVASDFYIMVEETQPALARFVANKLNLGLSPIEIATLLQYEADQMRTWCASQVGTR